MLTLPCATGIMQPVLVAPNITQQCICYEMPVAVDPTVFQGTAQSYPHVAEACVAKDRMWNRQEETAQRKPVSPAEEFCPLRLLQCLYFCASLCSSFSDFLGPLAFTFCFLVTAFCLFWLLTLVSLSSLLISLLCLPSLLFSPC